MNSANQNKNIGGNGVRYLGFSLGQEDYAMPLLSVREVNAMPHVTPIPKSPSYFLGIMNLRGQVISVVDLRTKLGIKPSGSKEKAVIICDIDGMSVGIVVDSVNQVLSPRSEELSDKAEFANSNCAPYIDAVYKMKDRLVLLLDIAKILSPEDHQLASKNNSSAQAA